MENVEIDKLKFNKEVLGQEDNDVEKLKRVLSIILKDLAEDQNSTFLINFPEYTNGKIEVTIKSIDFTNLFSKPIIANVVTEGLVIVREYWEEEPRWSGDRSLMVKRAQRTPLEEIHCQLEWFIL